MQYNLIVGYQQLTFGSDLMNSYLTRKESIILSAIEIIDEFGIHDLALREISSRQGISEAALYRHFKSKEEIVLAVFDYFSRFDTNIMNTIRENKIKGKQGIIFFIKSLVETYEAHPAMTSLALSFELLMKNDLVVQKVKEIFNSRSDFITNLIKEAQNEGLINKIILSEDLSDTIIGIERTITLKWRMDKFDFPLSKRVLTALQSILDLC
jgi:AcrR family transcriptional regulator